MNEADIKSLKWEKDKQIPLSNSLYIHIRKSSKTYTIRKRIKGKTQIITLGKSSALSLKDVKHKANEHSQNNERYKTTVSELTKKYYSKI